MSYFVFERTKVLDVYFQLCLELVAGVMSMVLAQVACLVTWRPLRHVRAGEGIQKFKTPPSLSESS